MRLWTIGIFAMLLPATAFADDALMAEMQTLERARNAAIAADDEAALSRIYAEDFAGMTAGGATVHRADMFAIFRRNHDNGPPAAESTILSARLVGPDVAVVTGDLKLYTPDRHELAGESYYLHVFRRDGREWHLVAGAGTPAPKR